MSKFLHHLANSEHIVGEAQLFKQLSQKSGAKPRVNIYAENIYAEKHLI